MNFTEAYNNTVESVSSVQSVHISDEYVSKIDSEINRVIGELDAFSNTDKSIHYIKGDIAEIWHAGTLRIDAVAKGKDNIKAFAPRDTSPVDVIGYISPVEFLQAQLKYYKTPEDTAKAISNPKYDGLIKIVPSDQLEGVKEAAYRLYLSNIDIRPEMAMQYYNTYEQAVDRLNFQGASSSPLSEREALQIAKEFQRDNFDPEKHGLTSIDFIRFSDAFRVCGEAALNAAILSVVLKTAPHLVSTLLRLLRGEQIHPSAVIDFLNDAKSGAISGALRGSIASAITLACHTGLLGESFKSINPLAIAGATVIALRTISHSIKLYKGDIDFIEFSDICLRDAFVVSFGIYGASIGQALIPVPLLGAVLGNFIGSIIATTVYEGGKQILLSFFIHTELAFFKIVRQDYKIPEEILKRCGFDLIDFDKITIDTLQPSKINLDTISIDTMPIRPIKRGLISVNTIGYV